MKINVKLRKNPKKKIIIIIPNPLTFRQLHVVIYLNFIK